MQKTLVAIALSAVMAAGCGGSGTARYVSKGMTLYDRADYRGALNEFAVVRGGEGSLNQRALARYYVYRGLTQYHLNRRSEALSDLTRGKEVLSRGSSSWLRAEISAEMDQALADLNAEPAGSTASVAPPAESATPAAPPATADALVPIKTAAPVKTATAAPVKTATAAAAPVKTAAPAAPVKTSAPPTKTLSSSQSTSPK